MKIFKHEKHRNDSRKLPTKCPSCTHPLGITMLRCSECETEVKGEFTMSRFSGLTREDEEFLFCFLSSRGSLKEVQERLSISYPTARARLDKLLFSLGLAESTEESDQNIEMKTISKGKATEKKMLDLLKQLEEGEKDFESIMKELEDK